MTKTKIGREKGKCDICGEPAVYQIYDISMTREYSDDGNNKRMAGRGSC